MSATGSITSIRTSGASVNYSPFVVQRFCRHITLCLLTVLLWVVSIPVLSARRVAVTTEGTEYWVTFMRNNGLPIEDMSLRFVLMFTAQEDVDVVIETAGGLQEVHVAAGTYEEYDQLTAQNAYMDESEVVQPRGVHIYSKQDSIPFSCFAYADGGIGGRTSRDATLLLPVRMLGKEYVVQTFPEDILSTEFAVVATEDNTCVTIVPASATYQGSTAETPLQRVLNRGEAFMVASTTYNDANGEIIDMSGSRICADKPVAVFNGNEGTKIPLVQAYFQDHTFEQVQPVKGWGTDFYLGLGSSVKDNRFYITAMQDGTTVTVTRSGTSSMTNTYTLDAFQSSRNAQDKPLSVQLNAMLSNAYIHSDKPILVYDYLTCGAQNQTSELDGDGNLIVGNWGNPANAQLPAWSSRVQDMTFFTRQIPNEQEDVVQRNYVQVLTRTAETALLTLDGAVPAAAWTPFGADNSMSYANIELATYGYHHISTTGEGFVGIVYGLNSDAEAYMYTLGYRPVPGIDSLFISDPASPVMDIKSYDLARMPQGWYQRQPDDWANKEDARPDTAVVCDSTSLTFLTQLTPFENTSKVEWQLLNCDQQGNPLGTAIAPTPVEVTDLTNPLQTWEHQFILDDESDLEPEERRPFQYFELDVLLYREPLICSESNCALDDIDTLKTVIRVNRIYNDTTRRVICRGDTLRFFFDTEDYRIDRDHREDMDSTLFVFDEQDTPAPHKQLYVVGEPDADNGVNIWTRRYESAGGCDSIVTLMLWVCEPVLHHIDTVVCTNEPLTFPDSRFFRDEAGRPRELALPVSQPDTVYRDTLHHSTANCDDWKVFDRTFPGCDSIWEVHIDTCGWHEIVTRDTFCVNGYYGEPYIWHREPGNTLRDTSIYVKPADLGDTIIVRDTLRTRACPDCDAQTLQHWKGYCDSVLILRLFVPRYYHYTLDRQFCDSLFNYATQQREKVTDSEWTGHMTDPDDPSKFRYLWNATEGADSLIRADSLTFLPAGTHIIVDSLVTQYGCDSIYTMTLKVSSLIDISTPMQACGNERSVYLRNGKVLFDGTTSPYRSATDEDLVISYDTTLLAVGNGCDTIEHVTLTVHPIWYVEEDSVVCQDEPFQWTLHTGRPLYNTDGRRVTLSTATVGEFVYIDSMTSRYHCDSLRVLRLKVNPSYIGDRRTVIPKTVCLTDTPFVWTDHRVNPLTGEPWRFSTDTVFRDTIVLPTLCDSVVELNLTVSDNHDRGTSWRICKNDAPYYYAPHAKYYKPDTISVGLHAYWELVRTAEGCPYYDTLYLTVNPYYPDSAMTDTVCRTDGGTYAWERHTSDDHTVWSVAQQRRVRADALPADVVGTYTYIDSLLTEQWGCDSIWTLTLHVGQQYYDTTRYTFCDTASYLWQDTLYYGHRYDSVAHPFSDNQRRIVRTDGPNEYSINYGTYLRCDSVFVLYLTMHPTYPDVAPQDTVVRHICDNDTLHWYKGLEFNTAHTHVTAVTRHVLTDHIPTDHTCDSAVAMVVYVHPTYLEHSPDTNICRTTPLLWPDHPRAGETHRRLWLTMQDGTVTQVSSDAIPTDSVGTFTLTDSLLTRTCPDCRDGIGCDSVWTLTYTVRPIYDTHHDHTISDEEWYMWEDTMFVGKKVLPDTISDARYIHGTTPLIVAGGVVNEYSVTYPTHTYLCDSTERLRLLVGTIFRDTLRNEHVCVNTPYNWYRPDATGRRSLVRTISPADYPAAAATDTVHCLYYDSLTNYVEGFGFDSIFVLDLTIHPTFHMPVDIDSVCQGSPYHWRDAEGKEHTEALRDEQGNHLVAIPTDTTGWIIIYDSLRTLTCADCQSGDGCDSVHTLRLYVNPVYDYPHAHVMSDEDVYKWEHTLYIGSKVDRDTIDPDRWFLPEETVQIVVAPEVVNNYDTLYHTRLLGCDSVERLRLLVGPVFRDTLLNQHTCRNEAYTWRRAGRTMQDSVVRVITPDMFRYTEGGGVQRMLYYDSLTNYIEGNGFDSIFTLELFIHPTYTMPIDTDSVCGTRTAEVYHWLDADGHEHTRALYNAQHQRISTITLDTVGWITVYDSLRTVTCPDCQAGEGCDSVHILHLYVRPIYHHPEQLTLCDNDTVIWQRRLYVGDLYDVTAWGVPAERTPEYDSVIYIPSDSLTYSDTARYQTVLGCDSIYYLHLVKHATVFTQQYDTIADNDSVWWFGYGRNRHEAREFHVDDYTDLTRVPYTVRLIDTLRTADGCDHIIHDSLTVFPSYHFVEHDRTCSNELYEWRGQTGLNYLETGSFFDSLHTTVPGREVGFDSVYELRLIIMPSIETRISRNQCKNDTIDWHEQRIFYDPASFANAEEVEYKAIYAKEEVDGLTCDAVHYMTVRYYDYYHRAGEQTICMYDDFRWADHPRDDEDHRLMWLTAEDGTSSRVWSDSIPTDSAGVFLLTDSLTTGFCGCDSIYRLQLTILEAFREYDTVQVICTGDPAYWSMRPDTVYGSDVAGYVYDTLHYVNRLGCDSNYYFRVEYHQSYYFNETDRICADEPEYIWQNQDHAALLAEAMTWTEPHDTVLYAHYRTVHDCDSTFELALHIDPVTIEEWNDTICRSETYVLNDEKGYRYTEPGTYYDTLRNAYDCRNYRTVHLTVVEPTAFHVQPDTACADAGEYSMHVQYEGWSPLTYTIRYDSAALAAGFTDLLDEPVLDTALLHVPMPLPAVRTSYIRPDTYHATVFFHTGKCLNDSLTRTDYSFVLSYPSWLLEQHWNDAIGILVSGLNGGYTFSAYQWYRNGEPLIGETRPWLYQPHWLEIGAQYSVALVREGEEQPYLTCPITPGTRPDHLILTQHYVSVVPSVVVRENPVVNILSTTTGHYTVYNLQGQPVLSGAIEPDEHNAQEITLPNVSGVYIFDLVQDDEGEKRRVKVIVE